MARTPTVATTWATWVASGTVPPTRCAARSERSSHRGWLRVGQDRVLVDVGDGRLGVALPKPRHELRGEASPPRSKKSSPDRSPPTPGWRPSGPRPSPRCPGARPQGPMPHQGLVTGSSHGSASRSIFPEVRVGSVSTTAILGTIAAGGVRQLGGSSGVEVSCRRDIAHEQPVPRVAGHCRRRRSHSRGARAVRCRSPRARSAARRP